MSRLTAPPAIGCNHRSPPTAAYTMPEPSGNQSKHPPPSPRPAAGGGNVVSRRSGPPSASTTTIADEPPDVATNAIDEPSGANFGSVRSRPVTHISGVMSGGRFVGGGTTAKIRGTCHTKLTCIASRARATMWFPRPERRCTDDDEQCQRTSPLRHARRLWIHRLTGTRRKHGVRKHGVRNSAHVSRQASATNHEVHGARLASRTHERNRHVHELTWSEADAGSRSAGRTPPHRWSQPALA